MEKVANLLEKISRHEALEIAKPWLTRVAIVSGVKSLYDVPEYFREKLELKGIKLGKKEFAGGLAGTTSDLLEKNRDSVSDSGDRLRLYQKLEELEKLNKQDTDEYKVLQASLEETQSTSVKEALEKLNKKLALTKEGTVKHSLARKEMARILREQRKAKQLNREELKKKVNSVLDDYTTQKVDGVTATRETLRTVLTATGTRQFMSVANLVLDGAKVVQDASQKARQDGKNFNPAFLAKVVAEKSKQQWVELRGLLNSSNTNTPVSRSGVVAKLSDTASKYGLNTSDVNNVAQLGAQFASYIRPRFKKIDNSSSTAPSQPGRVGTEERPKSDETTDPPHGPYSYTKSQSSPSDSNIAAVATDTTEKLEYSVPSNNERIKTSDRSYLNQQPSKKLGVNGVGRVTIDEKFNAEYAKKGLQPSVSSDGRVRNVRTEKRSASNDPYYDGAELIDLPDQTDYATQTPHQPQRLAAKQKAPKKKLNGKSKLKAKAKATRINISALSWIVPLYVFFQLPIALLNLGFFGLAYVYFGLFGYEGGTNGEEESSISGFFGSILRRFSNAINEVIAFLTGFDIAEFFQTYNPANIYMVTVGILFAYAVLLLLSVGLLYLLAGLKPLFGRGSAFKITALITCVIGYTLPVLNLFPWVLLWTTAVWKNPK